jgi:hypothetical protein
VKLLEPTFGGINLEDIKAPECFYIEEKLKEMMNIPVFLFYSIKILYLIHPFFCIMKKD